MLSILHLPSALLSHISRYLTLQARFRFEVSSPLAYLKMQEANTRLYKQKTLHMDPDSLIIPAGEDEKHLWELTEPGRTYCAKWLGLQPENNNGRNAVPLPDKSSVPSFIQTLLSLWKKLLENGDFKKLDEILTSSHARNWLMTLLTIQRCEDDENFRSYLTVKYNFSLGYPGYWLDYVKEKTPLHDNLLKDFVTLDSKGSASEQQKDFLSVFTQTAPLIPVLPIKVMQVYLSRCLVYALKEDNRDLLNAIAEAFRKIDWGVAKVILSQTARLITDFSFVEKNKSLSTLRALYSWVSEKQILSDETLPILDENDFTDEKHFARVICQNFVQYGKQGFELTDSDCEILSSIAKVDIDELWRQMVAEIGLLQTSIFKKILFLLRAGANIDLTVQLEEGRRTTALAECVYYDRLSVISVLLFNGADPNQMDDQGRSSLTIIANEQKNCLSLGYLLADKGIRLVAVPIQDELILQDQGIVSLKRDIDNKVTAVIFDGFYVNEADEPDEPDEPDEIVYYDNSVLRFDDFSKDIRYVIEVLRGLLYFHHEIERIIIAMENIDGDAIPALFDLLKDNARVKSLFVEEKTHSPVTLDDESFSKLVNLIEHSPALTELYLLEFAMDDNKIIALTDAIERINNSSHPKAPLRIFVGMADITPSVGENFKRALQKNSKLYFKAKIEEITRRLGKSDFSSPKPSVLLNDTIDGRTEITITAPSSSPYPALSDIEQVQLFYLVDPNKGIEMGDCFSYHLQLKMFEKPLADIYHFIQSCIIDPIYTDFPAWMGSKFGARTLHCFVEKEKSDDGTFCLKLAVHNNSQIDLLLKAIIAHAPNEGNLRNVCELVMQIFDWYRINDSVGTMDFFCPFAKLNNDLLSIKLNDLLDKRGDASTIDIIACIDALDYYKKLVGTDYCNFQGFLYGWGAVHVAAFLNDVAFFDELNARGNVNVNLTTKAGHTPLDIAISQRAFDMIDRLTTFGVAVRKNMLPRSIISFYESVSQELVEEKSYLRQRSVSGDRPATAAPAAAITASPSNFLGSLTLFPGASGGSDIIMVPVSVHDYFNNIRNG